jgi:hypothetical protein
VSAPGKDDIVDKIRDASRELDDEFAGDSQEVTDRLDKIEQNLRGRK